MKSKIYQTSIKKISAALNESIYKQAFSIYKKLASRTKRRAYVRSNYYKKEKIFLDLFWHHMREKKWQDQKRRLKYYSCAIDLIQSTMIVPTSKVNPNKSSEILHRFTGMTKEKEIFYVQIVENIKTKEKHLISIFPEV